jgi:(E)-4-hydroxy-3-methylbut-2-enyl-diphosphate synthase
MPAYAYRRRPTRQVWVGDIGVGADNPIRVQSMTTTRTRDIDATVAQVVRLVEVGCEIVRITAPTVADAKAIGEASQRLRRNGIRVPLVADIHFSPAAALEAAEHAAKVRVNPGNYADSKTFSVREYSDEQYAAEIERIRQRFAPLVAKCKQRGVAMRIGTNHGSLSDRIMNRFGDTPLGMVESALEFARICRDLEYHDIIFSMKASNPKVMIQAYRLLAARLDVLGWDYPLHLGVTEAGGGEDGRIKSAIGIGALLDDGLGDTIRVSLTEEPEAEVPVAFALVAPYNGLAGLTRAQTFPARPDLPDLREPYAYTRRAVTELSALELGAPHPTRVTLDASVRTVTGPSQEVPPPDFLRLGQAVSLPRSGSKLPSLGRHDGTQGQSVSSTTPKLIVEVADEDAARSAPLETALLAPRPGADDVAVADVAAERGLPILLEAEGTDFEAVVASVLARSARLAGGSSQVLALRLPDVGQTIRGYRLLAARLAEQGRSYPLHLIAPPANVLDQARLETAIAVGSLLCDGLGDSVEVPGQLSPEDRLRLTFNVLQGAGARITRTEYVACPSCGRTLFDLEETTDRIRARTGHLSGVKIAVMGCVVNGPGEMADADFGYVGGAPGKVNLYFGKQVVERDVPEQQADARLIELLKSHGRWIEPPTQTDASS